MNKYFIMCILGVWSLTSRSYILASRLNHCFYTKEFTFSIYPDTDHTEWCSSNWRSCVLTVLSHCQVTSLSRDGVWIGERFNNL
jgi:hypothetical protein